MTPYGLGGFLLDLRGRGLPVGPAEVERLGAVLRPGPSLSKAELREMFASVILTKPEQRAQLDLAFATWWDALASHASEGSEPREAESEPATIGASEELEASVAPADQPRSRRSIAWTGVGILALVVSIIWLRGDEPTNLQQNAGPTRRALIREPQGSAPLELPRKPGFLIPPDERLPDMRALVPGPRSIPWLHLLLLVPPLCVAWALWDRERRARRLPPPIAAPAAGSEDWEPWLEPRDSSFLEPRERSRIVFGIDRHVHEVASRALDLPRTVRATARQAGLPTVVYQPRTRGRAVWFWLDQLAPPRDDIVAFVDDMASSLVQVGLPFERVRFVGVPDRLHFDRRREASATSLEGVRAGAIVAVLTDGRGIARALAGSQRGRTERLLRELAEWPRLVLVDTGSDRAADRVDLAALVDPYSIRVVTPAGLLDELAGRKVPLERRTPRRNSAPLRQLAGALALSWDPVPTAVARELASELRLRVQPFAVDELVRTVPGDSELRARRLNAFLSASRSAGSGTVSRQARAAIRFFDRRLASMAAGPVERGVDHWRRMDRALLTLVLDPDRAAEELYSLHRGSSELVRAEVAARLQRYTAAGAPVANSNAEPSRIALPWDWGECESRTQRLLAACGFGGIGTVEVRMAGRRAIAIGVLLGWVVALVVAGAIDWVGGPRPLIHAVIAAARAWDVAIESIGDRGRCPQYEGFVMPRHDDLHPLGQDPNSGLWEFAVRGSGRIPEREESGVLSRSEDEAVVFVLVPGDRFEMGSDSFLDAHPKREVPVSTFLLAKTEMTSHQWSRLTGLTSDEPATGRHPISHVSWNDLDHVFSNLAAPRVRFPTEAEWEFACRAGTTSEFSFGDDEAKLLNYGWFFRNSGTSVLASDEEWDGTKVFGEWTCRAHAVGEKPANPFGLHDMHGNLEEWCEDVWTAGIDDSRVVRGGSWHDSAWGCRSAFRLRRPAGSRDFYVGFRPARSPR